ncbi:MAG: OsmC family protein [Chlamydiales bacterium]|nr:OsmC family protein [Chlamydiia bacterium]MCP5508512.1 OsmC family protein [Chlamydiales bacterium]
MSDYRVDLKWRADEQPFTPETYSREHQWTFPGGIQVTGTAAPEYKGNPNFVNPEEAYVASVASCHLLTFLGTAARKGFVVLSYEDHPVGKLGKTAAGVMAMTEVNLSPVVKFGGERIPTQEEFDKLHETAHKYCFIANSVTAEVAIHATLA